MCYFTLVLLLLLHNVVLVHQLVLFLQNLPLHQPVLFLHQLVL